MTCEGFAEVRRLTNEALSIDPDFNLAKALGAYIRSLSVSQCWHEPDDMRVAVRMAREVLAEARDDPTACGSPRRYRLQRRDYEPALARIERSLHLNPNSAQDYTGGGWVNAHAGRPMVAIDHFHRAMRLSPLDPEKGIALSGIGMSCLMLERYEEALSWGETRLREMPDYGSSHRVVIMALIHLGRVDKAKAAGNRLMEAFPTYTSPCSGGSTLGGISVRGAVSRGAAARRRAGLRPRSHDIDPSPRSRCTIIHVSWINLEGSGQRQRPPALAPSRPQAGGQTRRHLRIGRQSGYPFHSPNSGRLADILGVMMEW